MLEGAIYDARSVAVFLSPLLALVFVMFSHPPVNSFLCFPSDIQGRTKPR